MADKYKVGDTVRTPQGTYMQFNGTAWVPVAPPAGRTPGSPVRGGTSAPTHTLTAQEQTALENRRTAVTAANDLRDSNRKAIPASNRLNSGPFRGLFLDAAIPNPDNKGGIFDSFGALTLGTLANITGAISPQDLKDYQTVKRAENRAVSAKQLPQKGAQTESDAARYAMTGIRTSNSPSENRKVAREDADAAAYLQAKARYETQWANTYGLNGTNEAGDDMNTAFQKQFFQPKPNAKGVTIRRIN